MKNETTLNVTKEHRKKSHTINCRYNCRARSDKKENIKPELSIKTKHFLRATDICEQAYGLKFSRDNSTENLNKIYTIVGQIKR